MVNSSTAGKTRRRHRFRFSEADRAKVQEAVQLAEKSTTGEIVPWIVPYCKGYRWVHSTLALLGWMVATIILAFQHREDLWGLHFEEIVAWQASGAVIGLLLSLAPPIKRLLIPESWMAEAVEQRALASFMNARLIDTKDRNGVLIFIALFEHRVEILADRGVNAQVPKQYWSDRVGEIIEGIHNGEPISALCRCIYRIGVKLAEHYPKHGADQDELPNVLRED